MSFPDPVGESSSGSVVSLKEGSDHKVDFVVTSDPSLETQRGHLLCREGESHSESNVYLKGNTVFFRKVRRRDAGTYTVSSNNAAGKGTVSFKLNIKCE